MSALPSDSPRLPVTVAPAATPPALRIAAGHLSCEMRRRLQDLEHLRFEWDELVESVGGCSSLSWDACRAAWDEGPEQRFPRSLRSPRADRTQRIQRTQRIMVFRDGNEIVGLAPMSITTLGVGPLRLRTAMVIAAEAPGFGATLPVRAGWEDAVYGELVQRLIGDERCEAMVLHAAGPAPPGSAAELDAIRRVCASRTDLVAPVSGPLRAEPSGTRRRVVRLVANRDAVRSRARLFFFITDVAARIRPDRFYRTSV